MVLKHLLWDYTGRLSSVVLNLVVTSLLSRILHPTDYGFIGLIVAVSSIALIFQDFGLGAAIVQKQNVDQNQLSTIFFLSLSIGILLCTIVYFAAPFIARYYQENQLTQYFRLSILGILFGSLNVVPAALVQKKMLFKQQALRNAITTICVGFVTLWLAYSGWGIWSLMLQVLMVSASTVIINFFITKWRPLFYFQLSSIREISNYSSYVFLSNVSNVIFTRIDVFIIPKVFNLSTLGFYSRAQQMDNMVRNVSSTSILGVLFPYFSTIIENDDLVLKLWERYYNLICLAYFLITGIAFINANFAFGLLFGAQWDTAANYYKLLAITGFVYPISSLALSIIQARGNGRDFFYVEILKKSCLIPTFFIAYYFDIWSFLVSLSISYLFMLILNLLFLKRAIKYRIGKYLLLTSKYFLVTLIFIGTFYYLGLIDYLDIYNFWTIFICSLLYIAYFLISMFVLQPSTYQLIRQTLELILKQLKAGKY